MLSAAIVCGLGSQPGADDLTVRSEVDARKIGLQDEVSLTITLEGSPPEGNEAVGVPPLQNLRVVGGPSVSTQVTFINGVVSQSKAYTYRLQALASGRAEVGAVRLKLAGGEKTAPPIAIEVVPGRLLPDAERRQRGTLSDPFDEDPFQRFFGRRRPRSEPKILVEASPSRTRLHVGEPLLLTYYLYTQESVTDLKFTTPPQYAGFWSEDLEGPESPPGGEAATIEGENYRRFAMTRKLLYPTRAGKLTIGAATARLGLPRGFFDGAAAVDRSTKAIDVTVDPLPADPDFFGAVGRFRVSASLDRSSLDLGEAATVRFQVAGTGNLKWIDRAPGLSVAGAKVYPPQAKSDLKPGPAGIEGTKTWEFVVVPETSGTLEIPALPFTYFDPSTETIARARTTPLALQVAAGPGPSQSVGAASRAAPAQTRGALALRSDLELPVRSLPVPGGRAVAWALVVALALHGGLWAGFRLAERRVPAAGRASRRPSVRSALRDLGRAGRGDMSKEAAAALIERTMHDVFGSIADGAATGQRELAAREVLQEVHFIRYAPQLGDYTEKIRAAAARAADVVRRWA